MYFEFSNGYRFDPDKLQEAHDWCLAETRATLGRGLSVVVANTFVTKAEMERYFRLAYPTSVVEAKGNFLSLHKVDAAKFQQMRDSWEPIEPPQSMVQRGH